MSSDSIVASAKETHNSGHNGNSVFAVIERYAGAYGIFTNIIMPFACCELIPGRRTKDQVTLPNSQSAMKKLPLFFETVIKVDGQSVTLVLNIFSTIWHFTHRGK